MMDHFRDMLISLISQTVTVQQQANRKASWELIPAQFLFVYFMIKNIIEAIRGYRHC